LVGILLTALFSGKSGLGELFRRLGRVRVPVIWYAVVLLLLPVLQLVAVGIPALLGLTTIGFAFSGFVVLSSVGSGVGEELGWRGFALPRLQASRPAFGASLLLGVLWGLWHLPLQIARGLPLTAAGLAQFAAFLLLIAGWSVLFAWVYDNSKGSLFLMILLHAVADIAALSVPVGSWLDGVLYLILLWVTVTLVVVLAGPAGLSRSSGRQTAQAGSSAMMPLARRSAELLAALPGHEQGSARRG
ncbi:MAG TPA: CPBP family intramembrane glutamic endopeptidase, partial [Gemmataceae bacterium]|nr:CPBP family intramembrane glutamic endopeptidase [Gemmataceae bacterium]